MSGGHPFTDVDCADPDWTLIQTFYENGITAGCGGNAYCPDVAVTRAQMSVFLLKSEHGSTYTPPPCTGIFADVPCPSQYADWIEELYNEGITAGCGGNNFCPNNNVTEMQMATFLSKGPNSFGPGMWPNYHGLPGGAYYTVRGQDDHLIAKFAGLFAGEAGISLYTE